MGANHQNIADFQRAAPHQHSGQWPLALVQLGLDHGRLGSAIGVGAQFEQFGLQQDLFDQRVEAGAGLGRHFDILHITRHLFDEDFVFQQALADLLRIGFGLVCLGDRHDHRHTGRLGVVDGFDRLRHDAVIGRHHQHHDVGDIGAAHAHFGKGFVARRVEEGDVITRLGLDLIGADMLGDAAGFAAHHIGAAQRVEQAGLAVIDMAHDRNHRWTDLQRTFVIDIGAGVDIDIAVADTLNVVAEIGHQ